ncbi:helix-turn-helix domain-containing protein [Mucilaginibacter lacusdianchii]|uniref:helix-turn-helix domain-containing protein n=1 Tax=Mucilaginibacter lacusdianchii TaxID=2684211 RepID=UPI00131AD315|nr:AraC family transcriptional regulator [Mucilaginibacter sp. JXJ CY 39]
MTNAIDFQLVQPVPELSHLVESFWMLENKSDESKQVIILPDGRVDAILSSDAPHNFSLLGLESKPSRGEIPAKFAMFSISFRPLGVAYLFKNLLPILTDTATMLPADYFGVEINQNQSKHELCTQLTEKLLVIAKKEVDIRKQKLFDLIYASNGAISVKDLSARAGWSSRQINRYFQYTLGVSLKSYCNILRFRASFPHIKQGRLFPEGNFSDQSHFIREIKKYAGVVPKELAKNENDRFIQFSTLPSK